MAESRNIAFTLTAAGAAAIAVIRICGPLVDSFLRGAFSRPASPGRCVHGELRDETGRVLDDPVVVLHETGDIADLSLHGGPWVVQSVLDLLERAGFKVAITDDGPLDDRATDGLSAIEREVLAWLPQARTEQAVRLLLGQVEAWRELESRLKTNAVSPDDRRSLLAEASLVNLLRLPRVAIVGPHNAGKSTLANQLFAQERSITADLPGTTRDWVGEIANLDGLAVMLIDTPGQRQTTDPIEQVAIAAARNEAARADLTLLVLDPTQPLHPDQHRLQAAHPTALLILNKADRPALWQTSAPAIRTSAVTGDGIDALRRAIAGHFDCADVETARPRVWTDRQRLLLE